MLLRKIAVVKIDTLILHGVSISTKSIQLRYRFGRSYAKNKVNECHSLNAIQSTITVKLPKSDNFWYFFFEKLTNLSAKSAFPHLCILFGQTKFFIYPIWASRAHFFISCSIYPNFIIVVLSIGCTCVDYGRATKAFVHFT